MSDANFHDTQNPYAAPYAEVGVKAAMAGPVANFRGYAGFWIRFLAVFIDGLVVGAVNFGVGIVGGVVIASAGLSDSPGAIVFLQLIGFVVQFCYFSFMESSSNQATLGKMALGLKVVDLQGRRISFGRAAGRYLASILSSLILAIGYIMVAFTERKQGLHDMIAGTLVIKTR